MANAPSEICDVIVLGSLLCVTSRKQNVSFWKQRVKCSGEWLHKLLSEKVKPYQTNKMLYKDCSPSLQETKEGPFLLSG